MQQNAPQNDSSKKSKNLRTLIYLVLNTVLFFSVYRVLLYYAERTDETFYSFCVMVVYMVLLLGFGLAYLIYNRFLYRKGVTHEDLPDTMTYEEKQAFIDDGNARLKKSKWMMLIILPLVITFFIDAVDLFILDLFRK